MDKFNLLKFFSGRGQVYISYDESRKVYCVQDFYEDDLINEFETKEDAETYCRKNCLEVRTQPIK